MEIAKYIAVRLVVVALFVLAANELYLNTFWKSDIAAHADILENLWDVDPNADAIYFGESSNFHVVPGSKEKHRISAIINDALPNVYVDKVDHSGLHAGTYLAVLKNIPEEMPLKLIIVTMNFRAFDAVWRFALGENYLAKTETMLQSGLPIVNKFLVSLKNYDFKTNEHRTEQFQDAWINEKFSIPNFEYQNVKSWDSAMAWRVYLGENPNLTEENIPLACHYIKNFAFDIDTISNPRIKDFDEIVSICKSRNIKVFFNLLSENMVEADKLVGDNLLYLMDKNREMLIERYKTSIESIDRYIKTISSDIDSLRDEKESTGEAKGVLKQLRESFSEAEKNKLKLKEEKLYLETARELMTDTGIKTKIIKQYLPIMNQLINKNLQNLDFYVNFTLDAEFNETIKSRYRDNFNYNNFSEGEKLRIDLSVLFTWREIAKIKNSTNTNLLILDEVLDSSLDSSGTEEFMKIINSLSNENVFVISHKGDILVDKFTQVIKYEKYKNFTRVA